MGEGFENLNKEDFQETKHEDLAKDSAIEQIETKMPSHIERMDEKLMNIQGYREKEARLIAQLKELKQGGKVSIYHGVRGGAYEIAPILRSNEKGIKGGEVGMPPTYSLFPVAAAWGQRNGGGFRYDFDRSEVTFPGETETPSTLIYVNKDGTASIKTGLDHLSLVDFDGHVMIGPRAVIDERVLNELSGALEKIQKLKEEKKLAQMGW